MSETALGTLTWTANAGLGVIYLTLGTLMLWDLVRDRRAFGFSRFGVAITAVAVTCGMHHLEHGLHLSPNEPAGGLDLLTVLIGLPPGAAWAWLRLEALRGGRGDRLVAGDPAWLRMMPFLAGGYVAVLALRGPALLTGGFAPRPQVIANLALVAVYVAIGAVLLRTQQANRRAHGGWSLSGVSLTGIFLTCAPMHLTFALATASGLYEHEWHLTTTGWLATLAGVGFLAVVWALYRDALDDWHRTPAPTRTGGSSR